MSSLENNCHHLQVSVYLFSFWMNWRQHKMILTRLDFCIHCLHIYHTGSLNCALRFYMFVFDLTSQFGMSSVVIQHSISSEPLLACHFHWYLESTHRVSCIKRFTWVSPELIRANEKYLFLSVTFFHTLRNTDIVGMRQMDTEESRIHLTLPTATIIAYKKAYMSVLKSITHEDRAMQCKAIFVHSLSINTCHVMSGLFCTWAVSTLCFHH